MLRLVLVLVAAALSGRAARAAEDPFGAWAPADGGPVTASVAAQVPKDGSVCIERAVERASREVSFEIDQLTTGATMELDRYKEPFALCMVESGWQRVDSDELAARRVLGEIADCQAKRQASCAGAIVQFVHGIPGSALDATRGMEVAAKLCDGGDAGVCLAAASLALRPPEGRGLTANARLALSLATRGCERDEGEACAFAGVLLSTGAADVPKDAAKGARYLARACAGGIASACDWPNGPTDAMPDASLPASSQWCRYAAPTTSGPGCRPAPVTWVASPNSATCAPKVAMTVGSCVYEYRLGR